MEQLKAYLLGVCAAAIFCAVATKIVNGKGMLHTTIKMLCGIFMTLTLLSPLVKIQIVNLNKYTNTFQTDANYFVTQGKEYSKNALQEIILQKTSAYILDKAEMLQTQLEVSITLSDDEIPKPIAVSLSGNTSPYAKRVLSQYIDSELGIPSEAQTWIT